MRSSRLNQIEQLLRDRGDCTVEFLAHKLHVSDMTVRRDLQQLAEAGRIVRTHGGAAPTEQVLFEFQFLQRARQQREQKLAIAERAAGLIEDGQSVLLDSGTTTLALAQRLVTRRQLVVITTSLPIAATLQQAAGVETILLGGVVRRDTPDLGGSLTEANLEAFHTDLAFIGADAVGTDGEVYNNSLEVGRMLAKMASRAGGTYVVADSTKIGRTALCRFGNVNQWQGLLTDRGLAAADQEALAGAGVNVLLAEDEDERAGSTREAAVSAHTGAHR